MPKFSLTHDFLTEKVALIDYESYYDDEYSVAKSSYWHYAHHPKFRAYLVSIVTNDGFEWVGDPKHAPWDRIRDYVWVSQNSPFDRSLHKRLQEDGIVPSWLPPYWGNSANLCAWIRAPRSLAKAVAVLFGIRHSKDIRDKDMKGKSWEEYGAELQERVKKYALDDGRLALRIWMENVRKWPLHEIRISDLIDNRGLYGLFVDREGMERDMDLMRRIIHAAELKIPWRDDPDEKILSYPACVRECRKNGIPPPVSLSMTDEGLQEWEDKYGDKFPFVAAMRDYRRINAVLKKYETIYSRIKDDGRFEFSVSYLGTHTGRTSGRDKAEQRKGANMLNLPRDPFYVRADLTVVHRKKDMKRIGEHRRKHKALPDDVAHTIDLRSKIIAPPGKKFVICDKCVAPDTRILTSDYKWKKAQDVTVGDTLVGFPEQLNGHHHCFKPTRVVRTKRLYKECVRVNTDQGSVICSTDHMWAIRKPKRERKWMRADELTPGTNILHYTKPWDEDLSPDGQWLSGIIDGEGSYSHTKTSSGMVNHGTISIAQKPGVVWDRILTVLGNKKCAVTVNRHKSGVHRVCVSSMDARRLVGSLRPTRFINKVEKMWNGYRTWGNRGSKGKATVLSVERIGVHEVCAIETDAHTFIAEGLFSHNCQIEARITNWFARDLKTLRLIKQGISVYEAHAMALMGFVPGPDSKGLKKDDPVLYSLAKARELALGFQAGHVKFLDMAPLYIDDEDFDKIFNKPADPKDIQAYRKYLFDTNQHDLLKEYDAADEYTKNIRVQSWLQVQQFRAAKKKTLCELWKKLDEELRASAGAKGKHEVHLPSGRVLHYFNVRFHEGSVVAEVERGGDVKYFYGGKILENSVQATARDLFVEDQLALDDLDIRVVLDVYDEIVAEVDESFDENVITEVMSRTPAWASGLPIGCDTEVTNFYKK